VFGSSQLPPGSKGYEEARTAGRLLAQAGLTVCSGGYAGVMEAVSRGAKEAGGTTIGVTTRQFSGLTANTWLDREVSTPTFLERLHTILEIGQAYLGLQGGIGTLTEISLVWSLLQTHSMPARPVVLLRHPWQGLLDFCAGALVINEPDFRRLRIASTPEEAVRTLAGALRAREQ
jgi:uncharacterized protein (TIGR00730 family)